MDSYNRHSIILYVILAYGITWAITIPLIFYYNSINYEIRELWHSLGSIGPSLAGLIIIYTRKRKTGLVQLKDRILKVTDKKLFLVAFSPLIILALILPFEAIFGLFNYTSFLKNNNLRDITSFFLFFLPSLCYGFFEEIGWRGYLLPELQNFYTALKATIILTVIWWLWHITMFFYRFDLYFSLIFMFPLMLSGSIAFTFLFNQSGGSLLMIIIFHISYNIVTSNEISLIAILAVSALLIFIDIRAIKVYGVESLSQKEKIII
jgi:membrane protease YdiL (CAAX protease family)